jgi:hypothetical protein
MFGMMGLDSSCDLRSVGSQEAWATIERKRVYMSWVDLTFAVAAEVDLKQNRLQGLDIAAETVAGNSAVVNMPHLMRAELPARILHG